MTGWESGIEGVATAKDLAAVRDAFGDVVTQRVIEEAKRAHAEGRRTTMLRLLTQAGAFAPEGEEK
jgi:hypothetical protein